ncbi:MAG TPA: hypothetical protein VM433_14400 [Mycobacteriales bacterium]|nr:hypothetical protein [Mycobacteriales bacterium]
MALFARGPAFLALGTPRPDGAGWPDPAEVGRPSFEASTYHEMAIRQAFEPEAHAVADRLVDDVLPLLTVEVAPQDEPYLHKVFSTAARIGAGLGIVERTLRPSDLTVVDRQVAAALWVARRKLPAMQPDWAVLAGYFLLAGFHVARSGPATVERLVDDLRPVEGT